MPTAEEKRTLGLLRKCDVLSRVPVEAILRLVAGAKSTGFRARQVIYLPGDRAASGQISRNGQYPHRCRLGVASKAPARMPSAAVATIS